MSKKDIPAKAEKNQRMEDIISLCKRRGFIFQGSEIYGGLAGTWDYGPLGSLLKNNIRDSWLNFFVKSKDNMYLIDSAIIMHPKVWEASGHVGNFTDPLVEDLKTKKRYRADHLLEAAGIDPSKMTLAEMDKKIKELGLKSPEGNPISDARVFNMMLETKVGAVGSSAISTFLRPEEAQNIFINFRNVLNSVSPKLPFGIAQVGKAFRNEITPRDFTYRMREFEIMEFEYFIRPEEDWKKLFNEFLTEQREWLSSVGVQKNTISDYEHPSEALSHYSKKTVDLLFEYPFGAKELTGLAHRGNFDLTQHQKFSGISMEMADEGGKPFIPHVLEPTVSVDRALLAVLISAYKEDNLGGEKRVYLDFKPAIAPIKIAVFPLLKNKPILVEKAKEIYESLKKEFGAVMFDDNGNIGKRYRRQDEIGTPYCVTVDFETIEKDNMVTVRDRDSGNQERVKIEDLKEYFGKKLK
jgi:glycyl-tRNA synthetase